MTNIIVVYLFNCIMRIFFLGDHFHAGGPNEVNKNLLSVLAGRVDFVKQKNRYLRRIERIFKILFSDVVVCSGVYATIYEILLAHCLCRKIIYLMHGCLYLETGVFSKIEDLLLKYSDLILCVSNSYRNFISSYKPFSVYERKMQVLTNAINWKEYDKFPIANEFVRDRNRIILIGGGRILKRNLQVCQAIYNINKNKGTEYKVDVYGYFRDTDDSRLIAEMPNVQFHHVIPHEQLLMEFQKSVLFIQNSEFESFSLGVVEALMCGCNILISKNVGARDVISGLLETDIIYDPLRLEEISVKIENVLKIGNNERLLSSIDRYTTSVEYSAQHLLDYANNLYETSKR